MTAPLPVADPVPTDPAPLPAAAPAPASRPSLLARCSVRLQVASEAGMSTAEYAVGTVAACAFAAVLYRVVTGDSVVSGLTDLVDAALATLS
jgi:acyl-CoA reductase-like NAD-dependent aldehyde dehydrogenase